MKAIKVIAFDADDTLWVDEVIFKEVEKKFVELLMHHVSEETISDKLLATEMKNLKYFGYGIKGFMLSMIETAIAITNKKITAEEIQTIMDWGKYMAEDPVHVLDGVEDALKKLRSSYRLMLITKGDLFDQERKIASSGLSDYFDNVEIVSEKDSETYKKILSGYHIKNSEFLMVGNSLESDIFPVIAIGGKAIHVPMGDSMRHEHVAYSKSLRGQYMEVDSISRIASILVPEQCL